MSTEDSFYTCHSCKASVDAVEFLDSLGEYCAGLAVFRYSCPRCGAAAEFRAETGSIWLGYTYAAGEAHFSPEEELPLSGLSVRRKEDEIEMTFGSSRWRFRSRS